MQQEWSCRKGNTLLMPSGPKLGHKHLFAILLEPVPIEGYGSQPQVMLVSITSIVPGVYHDDACVLQAGDHPFVEHASYVDYRFTRIEAASHVQACVADGTFIEKEPCSAELLKRLILGALASRRIAREHKQTLRKILGF